MLILGINNMHDAAAVLVCDGKVIAAAEEERFNRKKHTTGFPANAIRYCLKEAGISIKDVDYISVGWKYWVMKTRLWQALRSVIYSPKALKAKAQRGLGQMRHEWFELFRLRYLIEKNFGKGKFKIYYFDHHLCHAISAFFVSPFERAAILTIDGAGEEVTTMFAIGEGTKVKVLKTIKLPHSLGQFYASITSFLGFKIQCDEYKVMGLAAYGEPIYADFFRKVIKPLPQGEFRYNIKILDYHLARKRIFLPTLTKVIGHPRHPGEAISQRHANVAASAQRILEEILFHFANYLYQKTKIKKLCLAGGVALNSVANGKLLFHSPFEHIFIQPAASDAGTALGAALYLYHSLTGRGRYLMKDVYLGPAFSSKFCERVLKNFNLTYELLTEDEICQRAAHALTSGKLIFWFQGRMEWGPRALGNRSLLADPRKKEMKEIINKRVKHREEFRPFAPSILEEAFEEYFGFKGSFPFMLFTFPVNPKKQHLIPAVVHVDGTARPQTVSKETNPLYWQLIKYFEKITGIPLILNTSFNVQEPIVCTPEDAVKTFLRTKVDHLILNNFWVNRFK